MAVAISGQFNPTPPCPMLSVSSLATSRGTSRGWRGTSRRSQSRSPRCHQCRARHSQDLPSSDKVLVAGAGLGGLTAALALHSLGREVHIYGSPPPTLDGGPAALPGASVSFTAATLARLDDLQPSLSRQLEFQGQSLNSLHILDSKGDLLASQDLATLALAASSALDVLCSSLPSTVRIHSTQYVTGFTIQEGGEVQVRVEGKAGRRSTVHVTAAALLVADGPNSTLWRTKERGPNDTGWAMYSGTAPCDSSMGSLLPSSSAAVCHLDPTAAERGIFGAFDANSAPA